MPDTNGWISVEDELPGESGDCLVFYKAVEPYTIKQLETSILYFNVGNEFGHMKDKIVTHWQPLPAPPGEGVEQAAEPTPTPERCSECRFWLWGCKTIGCNVSGRGGCRIHAPLHDGWPVTYGDSWCGEFERRGE